MQSSFVLHSTVDPQALEKEQIVVWQLSACDDLSLSAVAAVPIQQPPEVCRLSLQLSRDLALRWLAAEAIVHLGEI